MLNKEQLLASEIKDDRVLVLAGPGTGKTTTLVSRYKYLINELDINNGGTSLKFRKKMSEEAFSETAYYDSLVSNYFNKLSMY